MSLPTVTDATFAKEVLEATGPVLVDFWAEWCGPCKMLTPVLEQLDTERPGVRIVKLNIDENPETARAYQIMSIPTMALFQGGAVTTKIVGAKPKAAIAAQLDTALA